ncbi:pyridoxamine 5'-phosphate oxidase [Alishewanella sp. 16-MA]|uniref:Pyridoxine/pyridoxamine 5'-phosphate oxidase n=1 Tax=Alishewanella maricola TaxID=2795740 RepID=A0ABS8C6I0_9ALTE|nr:pyridoxamine 5'-phosphate oxidase [Alishewanella maricola]MCB5227935.1 pyridoxamine 5'-phosphate oxidase [Alishewanella maricola]MDP4943995.1 pyridoxamine 5'-phosphate oxidase [Alishewanella sp.]MDP5037274.1 pyridoxamine 5'-phosphate oxidase [Alishewanella sp.]MDP5187479.1 pyridoxamine 5'-phosphate oxidase [Alishewanella sp.]
MKIDAIRRSYTKDKLDLDQLDADPIVQFEQWLKDAVAAELPDPTAMCVASVDAEGQPSQRLVLLKDLNPSGFTFYTNLGSRKATELAANPKVCLHFPWHPLERQVIVYGTAERVPTSQVMKYFLSRPKESQLAAWASEQSRPVSTRLALMQKFAEIKEKFSHGDVSLPDFWGGFLVRPYQIEFWQGGEHRLHDRFMYRQTDLGWQIERLCP